MGKCDMRLARLAIPVKHNFKACCAHVCMCREYGALFVEVWDSLCGNIGLFCAGVCDMRLARLTITVDYNVKRVAHIPE